jgi:thioredoxin 1
MNDEREQFISEDAEVEHVRANSLRKLTGMKEKGHEESKEPVHVTDANFNEIVNKHSLALIDCWAPWCGPCQAVGPTIKELANDYEGRVLIGKLDVDENPQITEQFRIYSIPTMLIMKNGKEIDRIVGSCPKSQIASILEKHLK